MAPRQVPKSLGGDVEFGNFIEGVVSPSGTGDLAARLLLREIPGVPATADTGDASSGLALRTGNPQDRGRRFLPASGGCAYIDLDHLELATPEVLSAYDYVAYTRAMVRLARAAVQRVNAKMPAGARIRALANCSDGHGHSYGAHMSILLTHRAWERIVRRKPHHLACLAAFQVSSIVLTGAGKVGSENGRPAVDFQVSQRADFFESYLGEQTTYNRPIVNARCEPLCGTWQAPRREDVPALARLHVIFFDATLCQTATLLRAGTMQMLTAMLEAGRVPRDLALDDPLDALQRWSHDPSLRTRARLVSGHRVTAVELQQLFLDHARELAADQGFADIVPGADDILALWADTLTPCCTDRKSVV